MHAQDAVVEGRNEVERTGQAENRGRPSGGTDFLLYRPGDCVTVHVNEATSGVERREETVFKTQDERTESPVEPARPPRSSYCWTEVRGERQSEAGRR